MVEMNSWRKAWALLDEREKRLAYITLVIICIGALSSAFMVGSVVPFLSVLADPSQIQSQPLLAWGYEYFGFTSSYNFLAGLAFASFAAIMLASVIQIIKTYAVFRFSLMRMHSISYRLMRNYLSHPYEFFLNRHSGELGTRILAESREVVLQFLRPAAELVASITTVIAIVALLLWIEPVLAACAFLVFGTLYGITYSTVRRYLRRLGKERLDSNSERYRIATEAFGGVKVIKLLGREIAYLKRYTKSSYYMAKTEVIINTLSFVPQYALQAFALGGILLICVVMLEPPAEGQAASLEGVLPLLGVLAFAGQRLMPELSVIYHSLAKIQAGRAAVDAVYEDLLALKGVASIAQSENTIGLKDAIHFKGISYHYPAAENAGLKEIELSIEAGERIGVVGTTGAGKTTLADITLGLLSPHLGEIIVDGTPVTDENVRDWQSNVGYVPQDIFLTDASVSENIALGIPAEEIDQQKVEESAKIAKLDRFIRDELAAGYATLVGERGIRLSGGQIQRIGIARALYHNADFIVFDEATSALDNVTEHDVMSAVDALPGDKTILLIAHRLTTVKRCDRIVVLDKGRIVGCDTWEVLMKNNSVFQAIAKTGQSET
ncbi:MAG: ABC transporter ATP-binding protein [Rickettsiales bacterium]|nr:ABC transporter ATP-binding protein [Rickettsiales bacterium]